MYFRHRSQRKAYFQPPQAYFRSIAPGRRARRFDASAAQHVRPLVSWR